MGILPGRLRVAARKMRALLLLAILGFAAASLPQVYVNYHDGVLHFAMPHTPGLKHVHIHYQLGADKNVIPRSGKATLRDGKWTMECGDVLLNHGDLVQYSAEGWGVAGKMHGRVTTWRYAPAVTMGPRRVRGAVMFRDDFNGGSLDTSHWNYEVSMYGGMNWEFQVYTPERANVYTSGGNLYLKPTKTTDDPRWDDNWLFSGVMDVGQIWGYCTQSAQYGCHREGKYGILPPVMSGKVKSKPTLRYGTVEVRARIPKGDWIWPAIWMLPRDNHYGQTTHAKQSGDWSAQFHTWRLEWTQSHLVTS